jgi:hypothetical protein
MHSDWFNGIETLQGRWQHGEKVGYCYHIVDLKRPFVSGTYMTRWSQKGSTTDLIFQKNQTVSTVPPMYIKSHSNPLNNSTVLKFKDVVKRTGISLQQKGEILSVVTDPKCGDRTHQDGHCLLGGASDCDSWFYHSQATEREMTSS